MKGDPTEFQAAQISATVDKVYALLEAAGDPAMAGSVMTLTMGKLLAQLPPCRRVEAMRAHTRMALNLATYWDTKQ